uniref:Uncharacterized protein n=1 Tax=Romanomermis culicivorax TaxID=13658 RepID=A0A915HFV2_ROMCU
MALILYLENWRQHQRSDWMCPDEVGYPVGTLTMLGPSEKCIGKVVVGQIEYRILSLTLIPIQGGINFDYHTLRCSGLNNTTDIQC